VKAYVPDLNRNDIRLRLFQMFGPDHIAAAKDMSRMIKGMDDARVVEGDVYELGDIESWDAAASEPYPGRWEDYADQDDAYSDEEIPADLEAAAKSTDEAYITWAEARTQMIDLAKARGFYPVTQSLQYVKPGSGDTDREYPPRKRKRERDRQRKAGQRRILPFCE
jgi:hypothetical protein